MSNDVPVVTATYVASAQKVDGKISSHTWSLAGRAGDFRLVGSGEPATQQTEVHVCYDRSNLYVRFECFESSMDAIITKFTEDGSPVWQDDSVELFISPYSVPGKSKCHQFVVNAAGAKSYLKPSWAGKGQVWRAAVVKASDRWIADITIPFETILPIGRNDECWRVNFCRNEGPHGEASSWSPVAKWYATYSRFGRLAPPANAPFRFNTFRGRPVLVRVGADAPAGIHRLDGATAEFGSVGYVIPEPQEMHKRVTKGVFRISPDTKIVIPDLAGEADMWAVEELNDAIVKLGGKKLATVRSLAVSKDAGSISNLILIGESARNAAVRAVCEQDRVRMPRSRYGTGSHVVDVLPGRIVVVGQSVVDTFYGVQTLKQLIRVAEDGSLCVPAVGVRDFARFQFRGAHLLASRDALSFLGKLIENVLAPLKVNHIVLQTDKIVWKSHPEVTDPNNFMTQEDVKKLIEIARRHHITVTPLVQSPGHLEWAFRGGNNLEIAEDPELPYCYCMLNPKSYDFIFDIMDEAIELFGHPEYFHAGRDEFDMRGRMPYHDECRKLGKERLYIMDTLKVYEHLRSRGCKVMMWGDLMTKQGFRELIDDLPKDTLINDWRYGPNETYPTVDFYQANDFPVVGCTWYNPRNIYYFSAYAARRGILGMMQTTWTGFHTEDIVLANHPEQAYAYVLSAAWAWNPVSPRVDDLPYRPEVVFNRLWRQDRAATTSEFHAVSLDRCANISRSDSGRTPGWLGIGRGNDLRGLPAGVVRIDSVPYRILSGAVDAPSVVLLGASGMLDAFPRRIDGIRVDARVNALHFLHGCAYEVEAGARVGSYIVHFDDGSTEEIPLTYEKNIFAWDDQSLGLAYGFAWKGKAQDGRLVGVCELAWVNKRPESRVVSIDFVGGATQASPFLVAVTAESWL